MGAANIKPNSGTYRDVLMNIYYSINEDINQYLLLAFERFWKKWGGDQLNFFLVASGWMSQDSLLPTVASCLFPEGVSRFAATFSGQLVYSRKSQESPLLSEFGLTFPRERQNSLLPSMSV